MTNHKVRDALNNFVATLGLILSGALVYGALVSAAPALATDRVGLIDSRGSWILQNKFFVLRYLQPNVYIATDFEGKKSLFDSQGRPIQVPLPPDCFIADILFEPSNNGHNQSSKFFIKVQTQNRKLTAVINPAGETIIPLSNWTVEGYSDGYFLVEKSIFKDGSKESDTGRTYAGERFALIDEHGTTTGYIDGNEYSPEPTHFKNGVVTAREHFNPGLYYFFDVHANKLPIPPQRDALEFSEGFVCLNGSEQNIVSQRTSPNLGMLYMDKHGTALKTDEPLTFCMPFRDGLGVAAIGRPPAVKYGVIDKQGAWRVRPIYSKVNYTSNGSLFAEMPNHRWVAVDEYGHVLRRFPLGVEPITRLDGNLIDCVLHNEKSQSKWNESRAVIDTGNRITELFGGQSNAQGPTVLIVDDSTGRRRLGLRDRHHELLPTKYSRLYQTENNRWIAATSPAEFSPDEWKHGPHPPGGYDRTDLFHLFLSKYDLIGMKRDCVVQLLGDDEHKTNSNRYLLSASYCLLGNVCVLVQYKDDRVWRWCYCGSMDSGENSAATVGLHSWFTTNVVFGGSGTSGVKYFPKASQ